MKKLNLAEKEAKELARADGRRDLAHMEMLNQRKDDTSFTEPGFMGFEPKYPQHEVREAWFGGMELGIQHGLYMASLEGQRVRICANMENDKQREFYEKFLDLAEKYNCAISYHPSKGMCVIDQDPHFQ